MTRDQQLEAIRAACIKANPEIVELKFGCGLYVETLEGYGGHDVINQHRRVTAEQCHIEQLPNYLVGAYFGERGYIQADSKKIAGRRGAILPNVFKIVEIIGRPIRLADVMLAMRESFTEAGAASGTSTFETFVKAIAVVAGGGKGATSWNLRQDDLAKQSDECVAFLAQLLG